MQELYSCDTKDKIKQFAKQRKKGVLSAIKAFVHKMIGTKYSIIVDNDYYSFGMIILKNKKSDVIVNYHLKTQIVFSGNSISTPMKGIRGEKGDVGIVLEINKFVHHFIGVHVSSHKVKSRRQQMMRILENHFS